MELQNILPFPHLPHYKQKLILVIYFCYVKNIPLTSQKNVLVYKSEQTNFNKYN